MPEASIATFSKHGSTDRTEEGDIAAHGSVFTQHTSADVHIFADGSGWVRIMRDVDGQSRTLHTFTFGPEEK